ncbi:hypothetical protein BDR05DRAFT_945395 [Suillus weaverae]|nr:hypothetical protein BDR05DRAFT_945395 [Suillus weaverae]
MQGDKVRRSKHKVQWYIAKSNVWRVQESVGNVRKVSGLVFEGQLYTQHGMTKYWGILPPTRWCGHEVQWPCRTGLDIGLDECAQSPMGPKWTYFAWIQTRSGTVLYTAEVYFVLGLVQSSSQANSENREPTIGSVLPFSPIMVWFWFSKGLN